MYCCAHCIAKETDSEPVSGKTRVYTKVTLRLTMAELAFLLWHYLGCLRHELCHCSPHPHPTGPWVVTFLFPSCYFSNFFLLISLFMFPFLLVSQSFSFLFSFCSHPLQYLSFLSIDTMDFLSPGTTMSLLSLSHSLSLSLSLIINIIF